MSTDDEWVADWMLNGTKRYNIMCFKKLHLRCIVLLLLTNFALLVKCNAMNSSLLLSTEFLWSPPGRTLTCTVGTKRSWPWPRRGAALFPAGARGSTKRQLSRAAAQVLANSPRFTFVPSLFIVRKHVIDENKSSFVYLQQKPTETN